MEKPITYVGLDVHKETIVVALAEAGERGEVRAHGDAEAGERGEVRTHGEIANTPTALKALVSRLARSSAVLRFCYG